MALTFMGSMLWMDAAANELVSVCCMHQLQGQIHHCVVHVPAVIVRNTCACTLKRTRTRCVGGHGACRGSAAAHSFGSAGRDCAVVGQQHVRHCVQLDDGESICAFVTVMLCVQLAIEAGCVAFWGSVVSLSACTLAFPLPVTIPLR